MNSIFSCVMRLFIALVFIVCARSTAFAENFYKGKMIRLVVGTSPGGGYDTYTRTIARHIGKHIPGNPTIIVSNMPGAGTLVAANYTYNKARPNGLTVGIWSSAFVLYQALGDRKVRLDSRKVNWIGAPGKDTPVCAVMGFTGLKTLKDVLDTKKPIKMGGVRAGSPTVDLPKILNKTLATKFKGIPGYKGTANIRLALQARELDGACWSWESMRPTAQAMLKAKGDDRLIPFLIHARRDDPEVKGLPLVSDIIKSKKNLAIYNTWAGTFEFYRPWSFPPGTPKDRVNILRKAFQATMQDSGFLADARKSKVAIHYVPPKEIYQIVDKTLSITPETKKSLQFLVRKKRKKS